MENLSILFAAKNGGPIIAGETRLIDLALARTDPLDIPDDQIENVVEYLKSNLLHNKEAMPANQVVALEKLKSSLEARR